MKTQLASLDIYFALKELKNLEGSKADRIYNNGKEEIYIQLYKSNIGKKILRVIVGKAIFLTGTKSVDEKPSGFCMGLRKHLEGKFLDSVEQLGPERILKFVFKAKDETKKIYLEFFGKGNVILCNNDDIIVDCSIKHKFKDRAIVPKERYKYPEMQYNLFDLNKNNLIDLLKNSKKDKIVTALAVELGLGGVYSEEICLLSDINKDKIPKKFNDDEIKKIINSIKKIIKKKKNSTIIYKNKEAVDVVPIDLEFYKEYEKKKFSDFNEALDEYFTKELKIVKKGESTYEKKINELKRIIEEQKATIKNMKNKETENRKKAEMIYNNYQQIKEILDEVSKASKKYSWEDIKKKLKGHKVIKDVDVKEKRVVIDVGENPQPF
jgi:predicted ribosome quality control (RQC) complex YloA/Tae2 family protein|tara:strand:- start:304 stop:1443 length:1140 start_codon:yes stop_codon:yes gene_type:complete